MTNEKDHHLRISHAERRIMELEQRIEDLLVEKHKMAFQLAQCEAALIRLDQFRQPTGAYDVDYFSLFK